MHTRIPGNPNTPDEFDIPAAPGKPDRSMKIKLGTGKSAIYDVWQKDITDDAPSMVLIDDATELSPVTWFNNYGLKLRKNNTDTTDDDPFENTVDHDYTVSVNSETGKKLVVHTGGSNAKKMTVYRGRATLKINLGDPNIGASP
jgi:hypothetical protein